MPSVLLATCADFPGRDEDADLLAAALARLDICAQWVVWNDPAVDWDSDLVVLRSTWDYTKQYETFVEWVAALPLVANPADVVRWNTDKVYLRDLAEAGVPIVPTTVATPGDEVTLPDTGEYVVKPSLGAGSRGVGRFTPDRTDAARAHAAGLHALGRSVLVQPYLDEVEHAGETALVYIDGRFSHAIRKGALLSAGATHPVDGDALYVEEMIEARTPDPRELEVGTLALAAVRDRFGADQLYARVDLLPSPDGPVVIELELVEPSLFLQHSPDDTAFDLLATAIAARA